MPQRQVAPAQAHSQTPEAAHAAPETASAQVPDSNAQAAASLPPAGGGEPGTPMLDAVSGVEVWGMVPVASAETAKRHQARMAEIDFEIASLQSEADAAMEGSFYARPGDDTAQQRHELAQERERLQAAVDEGTWERDRALRRQRSASWDLGENGAERVDPRSPGQAPARAPTAAEERNASRRDTQTNKLGHDFSPAWVADVNKDLAAWCSARQGELSAWIATWWPGDVPPTATLEAKVVLGEVGLQTQRKASDTPEGGTTDSQQLDTGNSLVSASVELKADVGRRAKLSDLVLAFGGSPDWFKVQPSFSAGGEDFTSEVAWDMETFLGVKGEVKASLGSGEAATEKVGELLGMIQGETQQAAAESGATSAQAGAQEAAAASDGLPKVAGPKPPAERTKPLVSGGVTGSLTAGVEGKAWASAGVTWKKKPSAAYHHGLEEAVARIATALGADEDRLAELVAESEWLTTRLGAGLMGDAGDVTVGKAKVEGTVSAGASGALALTLDMSFGQPLRITVAGNMTLGLGGGLATTLEVDPVEAARLALVAAAALTDPQLLGELDLLIADLGRLVEEHLGTDVLTSDDRARESIGSGAFRRLDEEGRAGLVTDLTTGLTGDEDELALTDLLEDSRTRSPEDLAAVIERAGFWEIVNAVHGDEYRRLRLQLWGSYYPNIGFAEAVQIVSTCVAGQTPSWQGEMIADILDSRSDAANIIDALGFWEVASNLDWDAWYRVRDVLHDRVYRSSPGLLPGWVASLAEGWTPDWAAEEIGAMCIAAGSGLSAIVGHLGFEALWYELTDDAKATLGPVLRSSVYPAMGPADKLAAVHALVAVPCDTLDQEHIIAILDTTSWATFRTIRDEVGHFDLWYGLEGPYYDTYAQWVEDMPDA